MNQEVEDGELEDYVQKLASEMAVLAPLSHAGNKQILRTILANPDMELLTPEEEEFQLSNFDSADFQEGRRAFLEKRKPKFEGR
jgi:enoyl-CoA hydratase/carnithine racemase